MPIILMRALYAIVRAFTWHALKHVCVATHRVGGINKIRFVRALEVCSKYALIVADNGYALVLLASVKACLFRLAYFLKHFITLARNAKDAGIFHAVAARAMDISRKHARIAKAVVVSKAVSDAHTAMSIK